MEVFNGLQLIRNRFLRDVVTLAGGTAGAQALTVLFAPLITRIYGPEAFGVLGTFMAMVAIVSTFAALSYPVALVLPREDAAARALARLSITLSLVLGAMVLIVIIAVDNRWIAGLVGVDDLAPYFFLVPLVIVFASWQQVAQQWLIRRKAFGQVAGAVALSALLLNLIKVVVGLSWPTAIVLISIQVAGVGTQALIMSRAGIKQRGEPSKGARYSLSAMAIRYKEFALYRTPQNFINAFSQNLPVLLLASFFGPATAGFYALGRMVLMAPLNLVARSVGDVFYPEFTGRYHEGRPLAGSLVKATALLLATVIVPFALVIAFGPQLFAWVFGEQWRESGHYARWLALMMIFGFANRPCVVATATLGLQRGLMIYEIFSTGFKVVIMYWALVALGDDQLAVMLFGISGAISYVVLIAWVIMMAQSHDKRTIENVG